MRLWGLCAIVLGLVAINGCALQWHNAGRLSHHRRFKPSLLFDAHYVGTSATSIAPRSGWPLTVAGSQVRQITIFEERTTDHQGQNRNSESEYRRRFTTRRRGVIER